MALSIYMFYMLIEYQYNISGVAYENTNCTH